MAKAGMRRPDPSEAHGTESNTKQNQETHPEVPESKGKKKSKKK